MTKCCILYFTKADLASSEYVSPDDRDLSPKNLCDGGMFKCINSTYYQDCNVVNAKNRYSSRISDDGKRKCPNGKWCDDNNKSPCVDKWKSKRIQRKSDFLRQRPTRPTEPTLPTIPTLVSDVYSLICFLGSIR